MFIVDADRITNCDTGCMLMCYQTKISDFNWSNAKFKLLFGIRIDEKTHNWVIIRNEINLGFSYMTFCV
jgi:hypothetical protein